MDYGRPELADRLAADYAAGTLRGPARRRFETLMSAHPALREAVRAWEARLMPMTASIEPVEPPASVWAGIEQRLGFTESTATTPIAATDTGAWWRGLAFWRGLSAFAMAAVAGLAVLLVQPEPARAPMVVVLSATGATGATPASFVASISSDGRALVTRPITQVSIEPQRALELWALPGSGAPRSLGLISPSGSTVLMRDRVTPDTTALAVSLEPPGGSPTGAPTGPVLFVGKLQI